MPKIYIIILNYLNWEDTIECLNSLMFLNYENFAVVVIDNASDNESSLQLNKHILECLSNMDVQFLQSPENGGFAKGNNIGLKYAMEKGDGKYYWLLNNDTTVNPDSLKNLVLAAEINYNANKKVGLYGSKLNYFHDHSKIQAVGATYNKWLGLVKETGNMEIDLGQYDNVTQTDFLPGASFIISDTCLKDIGLMNEHLFLYFEELDWAERAKQKGWQINLIPQSVVFHKHGSSIKSSGLDKKNKSLISDFYFLRNKLYITNKFFPACLPGVYLFSLISIVKRIFIGQANRFPILLRVLFNYHSITWKDVAFPSKR